MCDNSNDAIEDSVLICIENLCMKGIVAPTGPNTFETNGLTFLIDKNNYSRIPCGTDDAARILSESPRVASVSS
jgi:hypothetical protein